MRDHKEIVIDQFNGFWSRGDDDSVPQDHFVDCNNIQFIQDGFKTRDGIDTFLGNNAGLGDVLRVYTFVQESGTSILALNTSGDIYDVQGALTLGPILHVTGMTDFGFVSMNGRAFISPSNGVTGLSGEFVYVYEGDGTAARKAGGVAPANVDGALAAANSVTAGNVETGVHIFGAVYETSTGFLTSIGPPTLAVVTVPGKFKVDLTNIPTSPNSYVTKVHIVATRAIDPSLYVGDTLGYNFYFVPGAIVNNGVTTLSVSFFDSELLQDATHLQDLYSFIPAGVGLNSYHNRLVVYATFTDISLCLVSSPGEPEAVNQIDGLIVFPLDGAAITNAQEFRDILYLFKQTKTNAWTDNGDVPSSWPLTILDQGVGASVHGISTVLDSGGVNVDYLNIVDYSGIMLFNGAYVRPELSWKIKDFWMGLDRSLFKNMQIKNDSLSQILYVALTDNRMIIGDYSNGMTPKDIRWAKWSYAIKVNTITLINTNTLIIGSSGILA